MSTASAPRFSKAMDFDDVVLARREAEREEWFRKLSKSASEVCKLVSQFRKNDSCWLVSFDAGSFNLCIKVRFDDGGPDWLVRFPVPGKTMFPNEKVRNEVAIMKFIEQRTNIPIPSVVAFGMAEDNPSGLGSFIITTFVETRNCQMF